MAPDDAPRPAAPVHRPRRLGVAYWLVLMVVRPALVVITRRRWRGAEHLPAEGGFVACSNHISHVDPFTLGHFLVNHGCPPRYLGKEEIFRIPVLRHVVTGAGQIPVYRESADAAKALSAAVAAVEAGECVGIYPEATLTRDPDLWPMVGKTGAARVALTTGCPVIPIAQWGPQLMLPPYARLMRWWRRTTVDVVAGPPVDLSPWQGKPLDATVLAEATETILHDITALLEPLRGEQAPTRRWDPRLHDQPRIGRYDPRRSPRGEGERQGEGDA